MRSTWRSPISVPAVVVQGAWNGRSVHWPGSIGVVLDSERPWLRLVVVSEQALDASIVRQTIRNKGYTSGQIVLRWIGNLSVDRQSLWPPWPADHPLPLLGVRAEAVDLESPTPTPVFLEAELREEESGFQLRLVSVRHTNSRPRPKHQEN